jgi:hypothetical protein
MANTKKTDKKKGKQTKVIRKVSAPVVTSYTYNGKPPVVKTTGSAATIKHHEPIYQNLFVLAANPNRFYGWPMAPGYVDNGSTLTRGLQWATNVGVNYQLFRYKKAILHYAPRSSTAFNGRITCGFFYDYADYSHWVTAALPGFLSQTFPNHSGPVWESFSMPLDIARVHSRVPWYTITDSNVVGTDTGKNNQSTPAYFAVELVTSATADTYLGDMFLEYEIEFAHPTPALLQQPNLVVRGVTKLDEPTLPSDGNLPNLPFPKPTPSPKPPNEAEELEY